MEYSPFIVEFTRLYLAVFFSAVAAFYTLRILVGQRRNAVALVFPGARLCTTWWNHMVFRVFRVVIWLVCVARCMAPMLDSYLGIFPNLQLGPLLVLGNLCLAAGFALALVAHHKLGQHWRSGIDPSGPRELVVDGPFRFSRNPMFLGVAIAQIGFFLALPSVFSTICLLVGMSSLHVQVLAEEAHLRGVFVQRYETYRLAVPRWF